MTTVPPAPTKKKMPWWGILLIVFGVLVLLGGLVIGGVVWWFAKNKDRLIAEGQGSMAEATSFAAGHDQSACVDEGLRKVSSCDGIMCEAQTKIFTTTCIRQAQPTAGFCDGVPKLDEIMKTSRWVVDECSRRGKSNNQRCSRLVQAVPQACAEMKLQQ